MNKITPFHVTITENSNTKHITFNLCAMHHGNEPFQKRKGLTRFGNLSKSGSLPGLGKGRKCSNTLGVGEIRARASFSMIYDIKWL